MAWTVRYFVENDGSIPAAEFEDSLPPKLAARLDRWVREVAEKGYQAGGGMFEACYGYAGVCEIRAKVGQDLAREYCTVDGDDLVLLCGTKKRFNESTPRAALEEAARLRDRYLRTRRVR